MLLPFQQTGVQYLLENSNVLLADDVGLGKTLQTLTALDQQNAFPALIICPAGLRRNWLRECRTWLPHRRSFLIDDNPNPGADIFILSYMSAHKYKELRGWRALVCDESQALGNPKSRTTRSVMDIARQVPVRYLLSATPVMNRPIELIPQLQILDKLKYFGGDWQFKMRYCAPKFNGFGYQFNGASHVDELHKRLSLARCWLRRTKSEVLADFPARRVMRVDVDGDVRDAENKLALEFNSLSHTEQFSHVMKHYHEIGMQKIMPAVDWITNWLDTTDKKLVVFAAHEQVQKDLAHITNALTILAETPMDLRHEHIAQFRDDPARRVMVCSLKAASAGIDGLQHATDTALFVEQGWNPATHDQAIGRLHRIGQRNCVDAYFLVIPESFDDDIWHLVQHKKTAIDRITGDTMRRLMARNVL